MKYLFKGELSIQLELYTRQSIIIFKVILDGPIRMEKTLKYLALRESNL